jgi:cytochrome c biogenesis protein CcdA
MAAMAANGEAVRPVPAWRAIGAALAAVLLATSWMLVSIVAGKAGLGKALTAQSTGQAAVAQAVTRSGITAAGVKVQVLFGVPEYYERTGQTDSAAEVDPQKYLVFIVSENDHDALAPEPIPTVLVDGKPVNIPVKQMLLSSSDHHRTRLIRFPRTDPTGKPYIAANARRLELSWPEMAPVHRADHTLGQPLSWDWPVTMPAEGGSGGLSPWAFLLLTAGLFAALSPCLIQLTLYYLSALAGTTTPGGVVNRRRILAVAGWFVLGITAAYVAGGVLAGYLGRTIQVSNVLGEYGRWIAAVSGALIIWMGFRAVLSSQEPVLCKMPMPLIGRLARWKMGPATPFLMGFLISLGCLQCFGGAIFASLLLYVGSLGSPGLGALMLLLFSLGVGVPFLAAALAWEKVAARLAELSKVMQTVSLISGVMMMSFGVLMLFDKFHVVSSLVIRWLPFLRV